MPASLPADATLDPGSLAYAHIQGERCARVRWTRRQLAGVLLLAGVTIGGAVWSPITTWLIGAMLIALLSVAVLGLRLLCVAVAFRRDATVSIPPASLAALDPASLPRYVVFVPLYREPEVVPHLLAALSALEYPVDRLDIRFLLEPDDLVTATALIDAGLPPHMRLTRAPVGLPRTKPRACNAGLADVTGDFLVIFDAEDRPEPDQLRKAVVAYRQLPADVVCLQCRLDHYNSQQSLATRWTTIDYLLWFRLVLPGLHTLGAPLPLGGTSNHFRLAALRELGGWDPFNVTEDCDLGLRIARRGWSTAMLASTTWEEAVTSMPAWVHQRSRWLKGYLQTWLVHTRSGALRDFGVTGLGLTTIGTAGLVAALLLNPVAWVAVLLWLVLGWSVVDATSPWSVVGLVLTAGLGLANFLLIGLALVACVRLDRRDLIAAATLTPFAWLLQSLAAWKAAYELVVKPFHWQKTQHGRAVVGATGPSRMVALLTASAAGILAIGLVATATWRVQRDIELRALERRPHPRPPPVQLALHIVPNEVAATGLVGAENAERAKVWQVVPATGAPPCTTPKPVPALRGQADFPTGQLTLTSRGQRDLHDIAALALDVAVAADAPPDLRIATHWRDEDGRWFEALSPQRLLPGAWTRLEFAFGEAQIWRAEGHQRGWSPDLLRRSSELGISFFSATAYHGPLTVANLRSIPRPVPAVPPSVACTITSPPPATVALMARWQAAFTLNRAWLNPFDPDEVAVDAELTLPDGRSERIPAFYFQDYTRHLEGPREVLDASGPPGWRVAYRAQTPGAYHWRLLVSEAGKPGAEVASGTFSALAVSGPASSGTASSGTAPATSHAGYLRRSRQKPELLAHADGSFFYPIGQNLAQAVDLQEPFAYPFTVPPDQGTFTYDRYFAHMAGAGMNFARIWLTPWSFGLEGNPRWQDFHGLGRYNLANAWRLDHLLDDAETKGISLLLTVTHQSEMLGRAWRDSALNRRNGGCLDQPEDFFTNPEVMQVFRKRLRYLVARWGDRPQVAAWEFFGEANLVPGFDEAACATWHDQLAGYVRTLDLDRHLIFTHTHNWQAGHSLWALSEIDCVQGNGYIRPPNDSPDHIRNFNRYLAEVQQYRKPVLVAEYGGRAELGAPSADYLEAQLHSGLWASLVRPFAGAALHWWWNFTEGADLYPHYRGLSAFAAGIDRITHNYQPVEPVVAGADGSLAAAGMQDADSGFYWIHHRAIYEHWADLPTVTGGRLLPSLPAGRYRVEWWDTRTGLLAPGRVIDLIPAQGLELPPVARDLGAKLVRVP